MLIRDMLAARKGKTVTISGQATLADLADLLIEQDTGAAVVVDDAKKMIGIISEKDIVRAIAIHSIHLHDLAVEDYMTADVISCGPDEDIDALSSKMGEKAIRHVPVVDGDTLLGIISVGQVLKNQG
ncbi:MAG: CBS domain-containing protein [Proteobacteria bacterium]|nr:CBS domain-containing protein [Pseudomonadota bacterium]